MIEKKFSKIFFGDTPVEVEKTPELVLGLEPRHIKGAVRGLSEVSGSLLLKGKVDAALVVFPLINSMIDKFIKGEDITASDVEPYKGAIKELASETGPMSCVAATQGCLGCLGLIPPLFLITIPANYMIRKQAEKKIPEIVAEKIPEILSEMHEQILKIEPVIDVMRSYEKPKEQLVKELQAIYDRVIVLVKEKEIVSKRDSLGYGRHEVFDWAVSEALGDLNRTIGMRNSIIQSVLSFGLQNAGSTMNEVLAAKPGFVEDSYVQIVAPEIMAGIGSGIFENDPNREEDRFTETRFYRNYQTALGDPSQARKLANSFKGDRMIQARDGIHALIVNLVRLMPDSNDADFFTEFDELKNKLDEAVQVGEVAVSSSIK